MPGQWAMIGQVSLDSLDPDVRKANFIFTAAGKMADKPVKILFYATGVVSAGPAILALPSLGYAAYLKAQSSADILGASYPGTMETIQGFISSPPPSPPEANRGAFSGYVGQFDYWLYEKTK